ncbi:MAG: tRNA pseudouridine(55) synthase TruB [Gammaproteobacteria bacterium]|nr:tRNA pseudouridine(55) synthase TruB [Gammaproteobacteria bacterium]
MSVNRRARRHKHGRDVDGILLLDKPRGISSNDALQKAKRIFGARKAGHTGNLDVQADGLLPVCFGEATKVCRYLLDADKRYVSEFTLGARTTTGDGEGAILSTASTEGIERDAIEAALRGFVGTIEQIPPMYSAIKRNGQPLYKLARQGIEVERPKRTVHIREFTIREFSNPRLVVNVSCSKGTYIRTLAEDLGEKLACGAHVSALRRERVGAYQLADAWSIPALERVAEEGVEMLDKVLLPLDTALEFMPSIALTEDAVYYVARGQPVLVPRAPTSGLLRLYGAGEQFVGVGEILDDGRVAPRRLFHLPASGSQSDSAP